MASTVHLSGLYVQTDEAQSMYSTINISQVSYLIPLNRWLKLIVYQLLISYNIKQ